MTYLICVEGSDNIGKTRLVDMIQKRKNIIVEASHFGAPITKNPYKEQKKLAYDTVEYIEHQAISYEDSRLLILHDRSIFGELIYSQFRKYEPDYFHDIVKKLNNIKHLRTLLIILYADKYTYKKFGIACKDEQHEYESMSLSKTISIDFINKSHQLDLKILTINSNNYNSLENRNAAIIKYVNSILTEQPMKFHTANDYRNTPFNMDNLLLGEKDWTCAYKCQSYKNGTCALGLQHKTSIVGEQYDTPTYAIGTINPHNIQYIFVGEAPGRNGCGKTGIPFYDDPSGNLFNQALWECNINLFNCYITNTIKCCLENNDLGIYQNLNNRLQLECVKNLKYELLMNAKTKPIAIGRVAHDTLSALGFHSILLHHPAYFLRIGRPEHFINDLYNIVKKST